MPRYQIQDSSGNSLLVEGDTPPSEQEIDDLFASQKQQQNNTPSLSLNPSFGPSPTQSMMDMLPPSLARGGVVPPTTLESGPEVQQGINLLDKTDRDRFKAAAEQSNVESEKFLHATPLPSPESVPAGFGIKNPVGRALAAPVVSGVRLGLGIGNYLASPQGAAETAVAATPAAPAMLLKWGYDMIKSAKDALGDLVNIPADAFHQYVADQMRRNIQGSGLPEEYKQDFVQRGADDLINTIALGVGGVKAGLHGIKGIPEIPARMGAKNAALAIENIERNQRGGDLNASQVSQAAAVHGNVQPSGEAPIGQVPVNEGGQGVRAQTEGGIPTKAENRLITEDEARQRGPKGVTDIMRTYDVDRDTAVSMQSRARQWYGLSSTPGVTEEGRVATEQATPADVAEGPADTTGGITEGTHEPLIQPQGPPGRRKSAVWSAMEEAYNAGYDNKAAPAFDDLVERHGVAFSRGERGKIYGAFRRGQSHSQVNQLFPDQPPVPRQVVAPQAESGPLRAQEIMEWKDLNQKFNDGGQMTDQEMARLDHLEKRRSEEMKQIIENQPAPKLEDEHQKMVDEAAKEEGVKVRVGTTGEFEGNRSGNRAMAVPGKNGGEVVVSPLLSRLDLRGMTHDEAQEAVKGLISHEAFHLKTPPGAGAEYWGDLTGWQKKIAHSLSNVGPGSIPQARESEYMGREVLARRLQRLEGMTPVEVSIEIHNNHFTRQSLETIDRIIQSMRELANTKASQRQTAIIDKIQGNIREGIRIYNGAVNANQRPNDDTRSLVERLSDTKVVSNTWDAVEGGLKADSVADLDALLGGFREWKQWAEKARDEARTDPSKMAAYAANALKGQLFKEAIQSATDSGSHTVEARKLDREKALPMPKLSWQEHPEVEQWLREHGKEVGAPLPEPELNANRRYGPTKRGQKYSEDLKKLAELRATAAKQGTYNPLEKEPITPEKLSALALKTIAGNEPTMDRFMAAAQMQHGPIQRGALREVMNDALVKHLENANGAELERMVDELKLRREVYGTYRNTGSSAKFESEARPYVGAKEAERLAKQSIKVAREGRIADLPTEEVGPEVMRSRIKAKSDQLTRLADKVDRDARRMSSDQYDLEVGRIEKARIDRSAGRPVEDPSTFKEKDDRVRFQIAQAKMRAKNLRSDADRLMSDPAFGEAAIRSQSNLFSDLDKTPEIKLGTSSKVSSEEVGSAQKMRARAISAILQKVMSGEREDRPSINRKSVAVDDLAWNQEGQNAFVAIDPNDAPDIDALGWTLTRGGRSNAATKTAIAGGRRVARRKGELETVSKRVTALYDQATGKVHLVSTWRRGSGEVRLTNPLGGTMDLREMPKRYVPIYSMMADRPLKGFHQVFDSREQFSKEFANPALERAKQATIANEMSPSYVTQHEYRIPEGTEAVEGEGGFVIGPNADLVRTTMDNALSYGAEMTEPEARKVYMEFSQVHTDEQAADLIHGLRDRIAKRKLTPSDYLLISAIKKAARAVDERYGDQMTDDQKAQQTLKELHDISIKSTGELEAVKAAKAAFGSELPVGPERQVAQPRPAIQTPPTGTVAATRAGARELTMRERVAPTVVRDAQGRPIVAPPGAAPDVSEVGGGLTSERERPRTENDRKRAERLARYAILRENQKVTTGRYRIKEPDLIAETPGEREPYTQSEVTRERIRKQIEQADKEAQAREEAEPARTEAERKSQAPIQDTFWPNANRRVMSGKKLAEATKALLNFGTFYDEWMADRIARRGGPNSQVIARGFKHIIDRSKQAYGSLTPTLDPARDAAGNPTRATRWLHKIDKVTKYTAISRTPAAIEGKIDIPKFADKTVQLARDANFAIGKLLEPVIEGFKAGGSFQRNLTALGFDILRGGPNNNPMWDKWVDGVVAANKDRVIPMQHPTEGYIYGVPISRELVANHFKDWKEKLDNPAEFPDGVERVNQDMRRIYPEAITHIRDATGWHEIIHANLFNYLETAAQRAAHVRAFREEFPQNTAGRAALRDVVKAASEELDASGVDDLHAMIRTLQGHPTDNYQKLGIFSSRNVGARAFQVLNQTFGNVLAKAVLTAQIPTQMGETISGSTPIMLGATNYLKGMARAKQIYAEMEKQGQVNRMILNWSWDPNSRIRSTSRLAGNTLSWLFRENDLNEFQEAFAASTANVVAENIVKGRLTDWEKSMLPQTFRIMGFDKESVGKMMKGDADLLDQFKRKAATYLTSGNRSLAEGSKLGANRFFNSIFRFQSYPMMKMNQFRQIMVNFVDQMQNGTPMQKLAAGRLLGRFIAGNALQGALTTGIVTAFLRGALGVNIFKHEVQDDPADFIFNSFMASIGGPMYMMARGARDSGILGMGEQATRMLFPVAVGKEVLDMTNGFGRYANKDTTEKVVEFINSKTPGTQMVATGMALWGISQTDRDLDTAMSAFYRWRRKELGFDTHNALLREDDKKEFKKAMAKAVDALQKGDPKFLDYFYDAAGESDRGPQGVKQSLLGKMILKGPDGTPLSDENLDKLRKRIGDRAYQKLEDWDTMLKFAANGVQIEPDK